LEALVLFAITMKNFTLYNNTTIPSIGFGTWKLADGEDAANAVATALKAGYRHIDTAAIYKNESGVGQGIKQSGIPREDIFVTTKLWNTERGYAPGLAAFNQSLQNLGLDYIDLYLLHWPAAAHQYDNWQELNSESWRALEKLYSDGKVRSIGVSNFLEHHLDALLQQAEIKPMVNQIEYHPGYQQKDVLRYCKKNQIQVEGWSPLGKGQVLDHPVLQEIAQNHHVTPAQVCIRWELQSGIIPLPKSATPSRINANFDVHHFALSESEMDRINQMPIVAASGLHPDSVSF
jgi:diketogulonate reductase-like aldo/keto reductase